MSICFPGTGLNQAITRFPRNSLRKFACGTCRYKSDSFTRRLSDKEIRRRWHEAPEPKIDNADLTRQQIQRLNLLRKEKKALDEATQRIYHRVAGKTPIVKSFAQELDDVQHKQSIIQKEIELQRQLLKDQGVLDADKYIFDDASFDLVKAKDKDVEGFPPELAQADPETTAPFVDKSKNAKPSLREKWNSMTSDEKQRFGIVVFGVALFAVATFIWYATGGDAEANEELERAATGQFAKATLVNIRDLGTSRILDIQLNPGHPFIDAKPLQGMALMEPNMNIQRAYTPLDLDIDPANHIVSFLIRRYPDGDVSRYAHSLAVGDTCKLRGPVQTYPLWDMQQTDSGMRPVSFIVGGTGIAPAIQYSRYLLKHADQKQLDDASTGPLVHVVYASRSDDDILLKTELDELVKLSKGKIQVHYFVKNTSTLTSLWESVRSVLGMPSDVHHGTINGSTLKKLLLPPGESRVVISGSEKFITDIGGARGKPLGGVLQQLGYHNNDVVRL